MVPDDEHDNLGLEQSRQALDASIFEILEVRAASNEHHGDLYDELKQHFESEGFSPAQQKMRMRDSVLTMILAGHETTASVLAWLWHLVSQKPHVYKGMVKETKNFYESPDLSLDRLPYLQAVLSETMRLYPPVWLTGRRALGDTEFGDYEIRKGTTVIFSQYYLHRHESYFKSPHEFMPERWLEKSEHPKHAYLPFGAGHRKCIGADFAWMEACLILSGLLQSWKIDFNKNTVNQPAVGITMRPENGVYARLSQPQQQSQSLWEQVDGLKPITPKFLINDTGFMSYRNLFKKMGLPFARNPFAFEMDLSAPLISARASLTVGVPVEGEQAFVDLNAYLEAYNEATGSKNISLKKHLDELRRLPSSAITSPKRLFFAIDKAETHFETNGLVATFKEPLDLGLPDAQLEEALRWLYKKQPERFFKDLVLWRRFCASHPLNILELQPNQKYPR